jgi:hypothetical protein
MFIQKIAVRMREKENRNEREFDASNPSVQNKEAVARMNCVISKLILNGEFDSEKVGVDSNVGPVWETDFLVENDDC